ncbi:MAG: tetratricopeptide repeat protein [Bacteroidetes bacterium]|nr:tetratricopeptide repeat protein [Bacteroidota bacterium]
MSSSTFENQYKGVCQSIYQGKVKSAIDSLASMLRYTTHSEYFYRLDGISDSYKNLLRYSFEGFRDTQRTEILNGISASLLSLADELHLNIVEKEFPQRRVERMMILSEFGEDQETMSARIEEFLFGQEIRQMVKEAGAETRMEKVHENIFKFIWLTGKFQNHHTTLIRRINQSEAMEWYEKCLVVSALTLSILDFFDSEKMILLTEFIESREPQVHQRALTGLVIVLLIYDQRIKYYPSVIRKLEELHQSGSVQNEVEAILLQFLMAKETEKITKEFEEEILPEMKKVMPRLEDKLQLGELFDDDDMEGKNPGWKDLIDEVPGLFERIEKFTKMQIEGGDVFMSTFSLLKRFDFFDRMSNWFVPFYGGHPELKPVLGDDEEFSPRLMEGLEKAFYICNSDKYSFAINFHAVPQQQRSMIITYFESELEQMKEMIDEEKLLDKSLESNAIMTQYIQDLYRFYKLYHYKNEFQDIFQTGLHLSRLYFYKTFFEREGFTERLAGFYFDKGHHLEAIELYKFIVDKGGPKSEYFEKIGYSYQQAGKYRSAIEYYKKADLFDADRLWILKKLGWCSLKLKDFENALKYFEDASTIQPDDLNIRAQIGHCHINLGNCNEALQHYSKVRFFQPDNLKVLRPIAYCQFISGKLEAAEESYLEILRKSDAPTPYDLINAAHVFVCLGKRTQAVEYYKKSMLGKLFTLEMFIDAFLEDTPHLIRNGIKTEEVPLLLDFLLFQIE